MSDAVVRYLCLLLFAAFPLSAQTVSVAAAQAEGADLVLYLDWQDSAALPKRAVLEMLDAAGEPVARTGLDVPGAGLSTARLRGFVRLIPVHGPSYQIQVLDAAGRPLAPAEPLQVRLACAEPRVCRFRFDTGVSAPGALVIDWELDALLDELPAQKLDLASWTAVRAPQLLGDARTLVWQLSRTSPGPSPCQCRWVLARKRPKGRCGNGDELGLEGRFVREASASVSWVREAGIALRLRCWRSAPGGTEEVAVVSGNERFSLQLGRPVLAPCAPPCAPTVDYSAELVSRSFAEIANATPGAVASARWTATLLADGAVLLAASDGQGVGSPGQVADRTQTDLWSGTVPELVLRSEVSAYADVPSRADLLLAVAGITWRLEANGSSACAKPEGVAAIEIGRPLFAVLPGLPNPSLAHGWDPDTGQIRVLSSGECPPGTVP